MKISNCNNYGTITGSSAAVGGVIGYTQQTNIIVEKCTNAGTVSSTTGISIGGVVGDIFNSQNFEATIRECTNSGNVNCKYLGGGIAGGIWGENQITLTAENNKNTATIHSEQGKNDNWAALGGIIGQIGTDANIIAKIYNCYNNGVVTGEILEIGGILGSTWSETAQNITIINCLNDARIAETGKSCVGGIVGHLATGTGQITAKISNSSNTGNVGNETVEYESVGGILGEGYTETQSSLIIENLSNTGIAYGSGDWGVGGIIGQNSSTITQSVTNVFYIQNSIYTWNAGTSKTEDEMKQQGDGSVLQTLNQKSIEHSNDDIPYLNWKQNTNGYPIINISL